jgi:hypothetical protein
MNTIDATPERSSGGRATLFSESYPFVNRTPSTNTQRMKNLESCRYGKQILNGARATYASHKRNGG